MERRIQSVYRTKAAAERFAAKLTKMGAKGVKIGRKTRMGYPVSSVLMSYPWEKI